MKDTSKIIKNHFRDVHNEGFLIYHQVPVRRTISIEDEDKGGYIKNNRYFLSFPNMLFRINYHYNPKTKLFKVSNFFVAFTRKELDRLYTPKLYNISYDLNVCCKFGAPADTIENLVKNVLNNFWTDTFNTDIWDCLDDYKINYEDIKRLYLSWEYKTKNDPEYIPSKFVKSYITFNMFFNKEYYDGDY